MDLYLFLFMTGSVSEHCRHIVRWQWIIAFHSFDEMYAAYSWNVVRRPILSVNLGNPECFTMWISWKSIKWQSTSSSTMIRTTNSAAALYHFERVVSSNVASNSDCWMNEWEAYRWVNGCYRGVLDPLLNEFRIDTTRQPGEDHRQPPPALDSGFCLKYSLQRWYQRDTERR